MKSFKQYIKESLLDDEDELVTFWPNDLLIKVATVFTIFFPWL